MPLCQAIYSASNDKIYGVRGQFITRHNATSGAEELRLRFTPNALNTSCLTLHKGSLYIGTWSNPSIPFPTGAPGGATSFPAQTDGDVWKVNLALTNSARTNLINRLALNTSAAFGRGFHALVSDGSLLYMLTYPSGLVQVDPDNFQFYPGVAFEGLITGLPADFNTWGAWAGVVSPYSPYAPGQTVGAYFQPWNSTLACAPFSVTFPPCLGFLGGTATTAPGMGVGATISIYGSPGDFHIDIDFLWQVFVPGSGNVESTYIFGDAKWSYVRADAAAAGAYTLDSKSCVPDLYCPRRYLLQYGGDVLPGCGLPVVAPPATITFAITGAYSSESWLESGLEFSSGLSITDLTFDADGNVVFPSSMDPNIWTAASDFLSSYAADNFPDSPRYPLSTYGITATDDSIYGTTASSKLVKMGPRFPAGDLAFARYDHTATLLSDGKVLVCGGYNGTSYLKSCEVYDPATNSWATVAPMSVERRWHAATILNNGKVLVSGGETTGAVVLDTAEIYDPVGNSWSVADTMNAARKHHTLTLLATDPVIAIGGFDGAALASVESYDPGGDAWTTVTPMGAAREQHTATLLGSGNIIATGGKDGVALLSTELYDPSGDTWTPKGNLAAARYGHGAALFTGGNVMIVGGYTGAAYLTSVDIYDAGAGTVSAGTALGVGSAFHTTTPLASGKVYVAGGFNGSILSRTAIYNVAPTTWTAGPDLAYACEYHTATRLGSGRVLIVGGLGVGGALAHCSQYNPTASQWSVIDTAAANINPIRLKYCPYGSPHPFAGKILIPTWSQDTVLVWNPATDFVSDMVTKTGFTAPIDIVFTPTKAFAVQNTSPSLKEIT